MKAKTNHHWLIKRFHYNNPIKITVTNRLTISTSKSKQW